MLSTSPTQTTKDTISPILEVSDVCKLCRKYIHPTEWVNLLRTFPSNPRCKVALIQPPQEHSELRSFASQGGERTCLTLGPTTAVCPGKSASLRQPISFIKKRTGGLGDVILTRPISAALSVLRGQTVAVMLVPHAQPNACKTEWASQTFDARVH